MRRERYQPVFKISRALRCQKGKGSLPGPSRRCHGAASPTRSGVMWTRLPRSRSNAIDPYRLCGEPVQSPHRRRRPHRARASRPIAVQPAGRHANQRLTPFTLLNAQPHNIILHRFRATPHSPLRRSIATEANHQILSNWLKRATRAVAGWDLHPLESAAFPWRTPIPRERKNI